MCISFLRRIYIERFYRHTIIPNNDKRADSKRIIKRTFHLNGTI